MYVHIYIYIYIYIHIYIYACVYVYIHTYICIHIEIGIVENHMFELPWIFSQIPQVSEVSGGIRFGLGIWGASKNQGPPKLGPNASYLSICRTLSVFVS